MNTSTTRFGALMLGTLWTLCAGFPAVADDTELFIRARTENAGVRPNVLFIIDNSGSMATQVITQDNYNPATTYPGTCLATRVYYRLNTGDIPDCSTNLWFDLSALQCQAARDTFATGGQFIDKVVQWDPDHRTSRPTDTGQRWELLDVNFRSRPIECQRDANQHGSNAAPGTLRYARDGVNTPSGYWGLSSQQISWTSTHNRQSYTLYSANYLNWVNSPGTELLVGPTRRRGRQRGRRRERAASAGGPKHLYPHRLRRVRRGSERHDESGRRHQHRHHRRDAQGLTGETAEEPTREDLFRFIRGENFLDWNTDRDVDEGRNQMGDPLHSQPVRHGDLRPRST